MTNKQNEDLIIIKLQNEDDDGFNDDNIINIKLSSNKIKLPFFPFFKYSQLIQEECFKNEFIRHLSSRFQEIQDQYKIKDESIIVFSKLLQDEQVEISNDKFFDLYRLSDIFKVKSLQKFLTEYAKQNSENIDFLINLLINNESNQNEIELMKDIFSEDIEKYLRTNINKCLQNEQFGNLQISTIYRIIEKSTKQKLSSDLLFEFIIKSSEKRFVLFKFLDFETLSQKNFDDLYNHYYMNETKANRYLEYLPTSLNYIKKMRENESNLLDRLSKLETIVKESKTQQNLMTNEITDLQNQIKTLRVEEKKSQTQINELNKENNQLHEQVRKMSDEKQKMNSQINDLNNENNQLHEQIKKMSDEKQKMNSQINDLNNEKNQLHEQVTKLSNETQKTKKEDQISQEKNIKQPIKSEENENIINIDQIQNGIIQYFDQNAKKMPNKNFIQIFINTGTNFYNVFENLNKCISNSEKFQYYDLLKNEEWIIFNFREYHVEISSYSIKSSRYDKDCTHIKSWSVDISNDGKNWEMIDEHLNSSELNDRSITKTFKVGPNKFTRYVRLMSKSECYGRNKGWNLEISHIEFYGKIKALQ